MKKKILFRVSNREGILDVVVEKTSQGEIVYLQSGESLHIEEKLIGRYPLEAIQLIQRISTKSGISHAIAATQALENYLGIEPTGTARLVRQLMLQLSTIRSHIHHFYWEILPNYLNLEHQSLEIFLIS